VTFALILLCGRDHENFLKCVTFTFIKSMKVGSPAKFDAYTVEAKKPKLHQFLKTGSPPTNMNG
jgi:hypothetical protein